MSHTLQEIIKLYPRALYDYFHVTNYDEAYRQFLAGEVPQLAYMSGFDAQALKARKAELVSIVADTDDETTLQFLTRRLQETELLLYFLELQGHPDNADVLDRYRREQASLYGEFDEATFWGGLEHLRLRAEQTATTITYEELAELITTSPQAGMLYKPKAETFSYYRNLLLKSRHPANLALRQQPSASLDHEAAVAYLSFLLEESGASAKGWQILPGSGGANMRVLKSKRTVIVSKYYKPKSAKRLQQVAAHEIFVHVRRAMVGGTWSITAAQEEEGVAILVEQLLDTRFSYKRLLRYMAAAVAWGVDGRPRDFRQTFEIVWRAFVIVGKYDEAAAKQRAFAECVRVFRGGFPGVPGAAYCKDKVYLEANLRVWSRLENDKLNEAEFIDLLDGRRKLAGEK